MHWFDSISFLKTTQHCNLMKIKKIKFFLRGLEKVVDCTWGIFIKTKIDFYAKKRKTWGKKSFSVLLMAVQQHEVSIQNLWTQQFFVCFDYKQKTALRVEWWFQTSCWVRFIFIVVATPPKTPWHFSVSSKNIFLPSLFLSRRPDEREF